MKRRINHYASFKDPAAKVFFYENDDSHIYRELSPQYLNHYNLLTSSGLANELIKKNWLIPFEEISGADNSIVLKARKIKFVSYPYEWTFTQWKEAALLTLKIQYQALKYGMSLKDASPFNIVFDGYKPMFIDISSFEIYNDEKPWQAFKQFSENFYLPILLIKYFDAKGNKIYLNNLNGIPLHKGMAMLPIKSFFNLNTLFFLSIPEKLRSRLKRKKTLAAPTKMISPEKAMQFAEQLFINIDKLKQTHKQTKWNDYYENNTDADYLKEKEQLILNWIGINYKSKTLIDFGCNTGNFSKLLANDVNTIISFDEDIRSVDELHNACKVAKLNNIFCFTANLSQPTPALGWNNLERAALKDRLHGDIGLALALIHHLAIGSHIQFNMMANFFACTCKELFIEFIPKEDEKIQLLLSEREDIFDWYNWDNFNHAFLTEFNLIKKHRFSNNRVLAHFMLKTNE